MSDKEIIQKIILENESKKSGYEISSTSLKGDEPRIEIVYFYIHDGQRNYPGLGRIKPDMAEQVGKAVLEICAKLKENKGVDDDVPF